MESMLSKVDSLHPNINSPSLFLLGGQDRLVSNKKALKFFDEIKSLDK